jgi:hypothetical protein
MRVFRKFMFDATASDVDWSLGMIRDTPRTTVPAGGSYDLLDFFINNAGLMYKRGGVQAWSGVMAGSDVVAVAWAPFTGMPPKSFGDGRIVAISSSGSQTNMFDITNPSMAAGPTLVSNSRVDPDTSAAVPPFSPWENPCFFGGGAKEHLILTDGYGIDTPKKAFLDPGGSGALEIGPLGGFPPAARVSCVHLGRLVLANTRENPNFVFFGPPLDDDESGDTEAIINAFNAPTNNKFVIQGDHTGSKDLILIPGARISVWGSTGNNGRYTIVNTVLDTSTGVTNTDIIVEEPIPSTTGSMGFLGQGWDTDNGYIVVDEPVTALASIQGVLLVFGRSSCQRILGDIPPGYQETVDPNAINLNPENMQLEPLGACGCIDARTMQAIGNQVFFANEAGIYTSNGAGFSELSGRQDSKGRKSGISTLWRSIIAGFTPQNGAVVCGGTWLQDYYLISVLHSNGNHYQFMCYLPMQSWVRLSEGAGALMYASVPTPEMELIAGPSDLTAPCQAISLASMWTPQIETTGMDAGRTPVEPRFESRFIAGGLGLSRFGFGHVDYDMEGGSSPNLQVTLSDGIKADHLVKDVRESPLQPTTVSTRKRFSLYRDTQGITLVLQQHGPSRITEVYELTYEYAPYYVADGDGN